MQFSPTDVSPQWPDMQSPIHILPQSMRNLDAFAGAGAGMDRQPLQEPQRVNGALAQQAEADGTSPGDAEAHQQQTTQGAQLQGLTQMAQLLQFLAAQGVTVGGEGEQQQSLAEFSRSCAAAGAADTQLGAASGVPGFGGLPGFGGFAGALATPGSVPTAWPWPSPLQGPASASAAAAASASAAAAPGGNGAAKAAEEPFSCGQRVEELNHYIRQQAKEYIEGQAEWSRQIAEVRSECLRELEKVKREKEEVERQARHELLRLRQLLLDAGVSSNEEGVDGKGGGAAPAGCSDPLGRPMGAWAAGVSMEEYQQVHRKWTTAEDRIRELEQYIKDQSARQRSTADDRLRDHEEEIRGLRQALLQSSMESRQLRDELQLLRVHHQKKVCFWERGVQHVLHATEHFLGSHSGARYHNREELENGRFGRTATKLSLTLPSQGDGGDVGALRRRLKDVLKTSQGKHTAATKRQQPKTTAEADSGGEAAEEPCSCPASGAAEAAGAEAAEGRGAQKQDPGTDEPGAGEAEAAGCAVHCADADAGPPCATAALSDSSPSSRDASPSSASARGGGGGAALRVVGRNGISSPEAKAAEFVAHLALELRQLLAASHQAGALSAPNGLDGLGALAATPHAAPSPSAEERGRIQRCIDSMPPARQAIAQSIMAVERRLRGLDRDLCRRCDELFGAPAPDAARAGVAAAEAEAEAEAEARRRLPLGEDVQVLTLTGLRGAQQQLAATLAEFLQLPQKLKKVFDLSKALSGEISALLPPALPGDAEVQLAAARHAEQHHLVNVDVVQQRRSDGGAGSEASSEGVHGQ